MSAPLPGNSAGRTVAGARNIHWNLQRDPLYMGGLIDGTLSIDGKNTGYTKVLRAGTIMAQVTATKKWVPCKRTQLNGSFTNNDSFVVDNASAFRVGDTITVGAVTGQVIEAINYGTNTITIDGDGSLDGTDNAVVFASGALAGAENAKAILDEIDGVDLIDPVALTARDLTTGKLCFGGCIKKSMLLGDIDAILAVANQLDDIVLDQTQGYSALPVATA